MKVDMSKVESGDTIVKRDGSKHLVTGVLELVDGIDLYPFCLALEGKLGESYQKDGRWFSSIFTSDNDIVEIIKGS